MSRLRLSTTARLDLFVKAKGQCQECQSKIESGQFWDLDHIIPKALGGSDDPRNLQILCRACHCAKTGRYDVPRIAKAKRQRSRHLGAQQSRAIIPGSRRSPWKRKIDGSVVKRTAIRNIK